MTRGAAMHEESGVARPPGLQWPPTTPEELPMPIRISSVNKKIAANYKVAIGKGVPGDVVSLEIQ